MHRVGRMRSKRHYPISLSRAWCRSLRRPRHEPIFQEMISTQQSHSQQLHFPVEEWTNDPWNETTNILLCFYLPRITYLDFNIIQHDTVLKSHTGGYTSICWYRDIGSNLFTYIRLQSFVQHRIIQKQSYWITFAVGCTLADGWT